MYMKLQTISAAKSWLYNIQQNVTTLACMSSYYEVLDLSFLHLSFSYNKVFRKMQNKITDPSTVTYDQMLSG